jgi:hypothetical protein
VISPVKVEAVVVSGRILGNCLVDPDTDLPARLQSATDQVSLDQFLSDIERFRHYVYR